MEPVEQDSMKRKNKLASGAVAAAAVIAANLLVMNAEDASGQGFYDLVADRASTAIGVAIPPAPAPVDATRVAAPDLDGVPSLDDIEFVVPVLERRGAILPELPEPDGAPWITDGIPPAPRAPIAVAPPEVDDVEPLDEVRLEVPELKLPASAAATPSGR